MILPPGLTRLTWSDYFSKRIVSIIEQTECLRMSLRGYINPVYALQLEVYYLIKQHEDT